MCSDALPGDQPPPWLAGGQVSSSGHASTSRCHSAAIGGHGCASIAAIISACQVSGAVIASSDQLRGVGGVPPFRQFTAVSLPYLRSHTRHFLGVKFLNQIAL